MRATSPRITGFGYARVGMIASEMLTPDKYSQMKLAC